MAVRSWFKDAKDWADYTNNLLRKRDLDNVVLFAGDPGNGKSTLMLQIARLLDPTFEINRIHFTVNNFLNDAKQRKPFECVAADELLMHRRKSMTKENIDMVDFMQVCRALNLHILLCFPHAGMLDRAVLDRRVRYRIDVPKQGIAQLSERHFKTIRDISGREDYAVVWTPASKPWHFGPNSGPFWEDYLAKKLSAARQREAEARGFEDVDTMEKIDDIRKGNGKTVDKKKSGHRMPKFLSREGRHPRGCGIAFPCPTGAH